MTLHQLTQSTVRLIGSAQVITSVHSVVKELLENSLDACATSVEIKLENHGLDRIEVRDNGCGILKQDTKFMAKPHYTSKISHTDDLRHLETYGFRGEALDVAVTTKTEQEEVSATYSLNSGGDVTSTKPSHMGQGTTVVVSNLFNNLPVRKQFYKTVKKKREELKKVEELVMSFSIIRHDVRFTLRHNKEVLWQSCAVPSVKDVLLKLFGVGAISLMEHVIKQDENSRVTVEMFVPKKNCDIQQCSRSSSDWVFVYVNKRPVSMKQIEKKVKAAFNEALKTDSPRTPLAFVSVTVQLDQVDVNLEPNKTTVLLHNQNAVDELLDAILADVYDGAKGGSDGEAMCQVSSESLEQFEKVKATNSDHKVPKKSSHDAPKVRSSLSSEEERNTPHLGDGDSFLPSAVLCDLLEDEFTTSTQVPSSSASERLPNSEEMIVCCTARGSTTDPSLVSTGDKVKDKRDKEERSDITMTYGDFTRSCKGSIETDNSQVERRPTTGKETSPLNVNDITPSQWSRGSALRSPSGAVEPMQLLAPRSSKPQTLSSLSPIRKPEKLKINKLQSPAQCSLYDVVNQQVVKRPTTSYIFFSREVRPEVLKENPGASFQEIARLIGQKWNSLSAAEKQKYERLMTKDVERYREQVYSSKINGSAQPTKRRKPEEANPRRSSDATKRQHEEESVQHNRHEFPVPFSMAQLVRFYANRSAKRSSQVPSGKTMHFIGPLNAHGVWIATEDSNLVVYQPIRAQEMIVYKRLLVHHTVPTRQLENPIVLNPSLVGGAENWKILLKLSRSEGVPPDPFTYISDPRVCRSGFAVRCLQTEGAGVKFEVTRMCADLSIRDLAEILDSISRNNDLSTDDARPAKVKGFLQAEATRMAQKLPEYLVRDEVKDIAKQFSKVMLACDPQHPKCFHDKPIAQVVYRFQDVQSSQWTEDTQTLNVTSCSGDIPNTRNDSDREETQLPRFDMESSFDLGTPVL